MNASKETNRHVSVRLTSIVVAAVFVMGMIFIPTGTFGTETSATADPNAKTAVAADNASNPAGEDLQRHDAQAADTGSQDADAAGMETPTDGTGVDLNNAQEGLTEGTVKDPANGPIERDAAAGAPDAEDPDGTGGLPDSGSASDVASMEDLLQVNGESGSVTDLEDLSEDDYNGFVFKIREDTTKREIKEMETAIDELASEQPQDQQTAEAEEVRDNELYTADSLETIAEVADSDTIEYIEPNYAIQTFAAPNDPFYANDGWFLDMIKAPYLWDRNSFGQGAVVAVTDSGVKRTHEDFENTTFKDQYNTIKNSTLVPDDTGHGTAVTGIIAASYNNGKGLTGVAPAATIMPVKVTGRNSGYHVDLVEGIDYAVAKGADVINISLGGDMSSNILKEACDRAAAKGVILVAASGNDYRNVINYPAAYDSVICVGSIEQDGAHSNFSTYNKYVEVVAPGRNILHMVSPDLTINGKRYNYYRGYGTSFSVPQVAAMAAMVKSIDHSVNVSGFRQILKATCIDKGAKGRDDYFGYGLMDLSRAYRYMKGEIGFYTASLSTTSYVYNGKVRKPAVTVKKLNKVLAGTNYKVSYAKGCKAVGTYKITITGTGSYTGTKTLQFKIVPPLVKKIKSPVRYKNKLTVRWYAMSKSQNAKYKSAITGFQVRVATKSDFSNARYIKVKGVAKTNATVSKLKRKTTYYVQYRAYKTVGKTTYYSAWSGKKKAKNK